MIKKLEALERDSLMEIGSVQGIEALDLVRQKYLGRKEGLLASILGTLGTMSPEDRKVVGPRANQLKGALEKALEQRRLVLEENIFNQELASRVVDLSLPARPLKRGGVHPLTRVMDEITGVFDRLGFVVAEGPEVETDENNFTSLNHPPDHPARDSHDTFYIKDFVDSEGKPLLLRTHTSPVQIRYLRAHPPPVYLVAPGRVFRHENIDATHSHVFHQVEGLAVDTGISLADLKGMLTLFAKRLFGNRGVRVTTRFRPSFFPFVEPGLEMDISCTMCSGAGCRVCKNTGWVEMLGAGLVHPNVLRSAGLDPERLSGWAFGIGVERVAMFKYGVDDMRLFFENDVRFLESLS